MKILQLKSITLSLLVTILISLSTAEISLAQLTTDNGNLYFQSTKQYLKGNNGINLKYRSNNATTAAFWLYNGAETRLGSVYGAHTDSGKYFGLLDADGHWSLVSKNDSWIAFKIDNENKMILNKSGQLDLSSTSDANGNPGSGVLEIGNSLRLDNNEIITNTNEALFLNNDNNGDVVMGSKLFRLDADQDCIRIGDVVPAGGKKYKLYVEKGILTEKVRVAVKNSSEWADYVFEENYDLMPINELQDYVNENKHLPNVPSANEVVENGIDMAEMDATLLEKIEEAYLYIMKQQQEIEDLKNAIKSIK